MNNNLSLSISVVLFFCFTNLAIAQDSLPVEKEKICFCDVITADSLSSYEIINRIQPILESLPGYEDVANPGNNLNETIALKRLGFLVYIKRITQQVDGKILFDATFEISDGQLTYSFTSFLFNPYARNRYGKFTSESGKYKPLEEDFKGNTKEWENHKRKVETTIQAQITKLKEALQ